MTLHKRCLSQSLNYINVAMWLLAAVLGTNKIFLWHKLWFIVNSKDSFWNHLLGGCFFNIENIFQASLGVFRRLIDVIRSLAHLSCLMSRGKWMGSGLEGFFSQVLQTTQLTLISWKMCFLGNEGVTLGVINIGCLEPLRGRGRGRRRKKNKTPNKKKVLLCSLEKHFAIN